MPSLDGTKPSPIQWMDQELSPKSWRIRVVWITSRFGPPKQALKLVYITTSSGQGRRNSTSSHTWSATDESLMVTKIIFWTFHLMPCIAQSAMLSVVSVDVEHWSIWRGHWQNYSITVPDHQNLVSQDNQDPVELEFFSNPLLSMQGWTNIFCHFQKPDNKTLFN